MPLPPLTVHLSRFSDKAGKAIIAAGGSCLSVYHNRLSLRQEVFPEKFAGREVTPAGPTRRPDIGELVVILLVVLRAGLCAGCVRAHSVSGSLDARVGTNTGRQDMSRRAMLGQLWDRTIAASNCFALAVDAVDGLTPKTWRQRRRSENPLTLEFYTNPEKYGYLADKKDAFFTERGWEPDSKKRRAMRERARATKLGVAQPEQAVEEAVAQ